MSYVFSAGDAEEAKLDKEARQTISVLTEQKQRVDGKRFDGEKKRVGSVKSSSSFERWAEGGNGGRGKEKLLAGKVFSCMWVQVPPSCGIETPTSSFIVCGYIRAPAPATDMWLAHDGQNVHLKVGISAVLNSICSDALAMACQYRLNSSR